MRTRKPTSKKPASKKVKKYAVGGDLRVAPMDPAGLSPAPDIIAPMPEYPGFGKNNSGGATGYVQDIQQSARGAAKELGAAQKAIGDTGGGFRPVPFKKGGKVRGAGKAIKGVRPCKMR